MSFTDARRLAGKVDAFFFQESKHAVNRLAQKTTNTKPTSNNLPSATDQEFQADVLPGVLRHSLPSNICGKPPDSSSKWALHSEPSSGSAVSPDALNPLRAYVSLPRVSFGPKRWQLPS